VVPAPAPVASPLLLIVAAEALVDVHVTLFVIVFTLLSLYVPVALNCCVPPIGIDGFTGVTLIDTSAAEITIRFVEPVMLPRLAPMAVVPVPMDPWNPS